MVNEIPTTRIKKSEAIEQCLEPMIEKPRWHSRWSDMDKTKYTKPIHGYWMEDILERTRWILKNKVLCRRRKQRKNHLRHKHEQTNKKGKKGNR